MNLEKNESFDTDSTDFHGYCFESVLIGEIRVMSLS
jgi:hypothetical protein